MGFYYMCLFWLGRGNTPFLISAQKIRGLRPEVEAMKKLHRKKPSMKKYRKKAMKHAKKK